MSLQTRKAYEHIKRFGFLYGARWILRPEANLVRLTKAKRRACEPVARAVAPRKFPLIQTYPPLGLILLIEKAKLGPYGTSFFRPRNLV